MKSCVLLVLLACLVARSTGCDVPGYLDCALTFFNKYKSANTEDDDIHTRVCADYQLFATCAEPLVSGCPAEITTAYTQAKDAYDATCSDGDQSCDVVLYTVCAAKFVGKYTEADMDNEDLRETMCSDYEVYASCVESLIDGCSGYVMDAFYDEKNKFGAVCGAASLTIGVTMMTIMVALAAMMTGN